MDASGFVRFQGSRAIFGGNCQVDSISSLATGLQSALAIHKGASLEIDLQDVEDADESFFQILSSLRRSLQSRGASMDILPLPLTHPCREAATDLGYQLLADESDVS